MLRASTAVWTQLVSCLAGNASSELVTVTARTKMKRYLTARLQGTAPRSATVRILEKPTLRQLGLCSWIDEHHNVLITGPTESMTLCTTSRSC